MTRGLFITGTDTEIGKTQLSCALIHALHQHGYRCAAMKPVASGCRASESGLRNADALALQAVAQAHCDYQTLNPYACAAPIAPHIAATLEHRTIQLERIAALYKEISSQAQWTIVEGVGGWEVPLNAQQTSADLASLLGLPVVLVVGMRLGCINHALLSYQAIVNKGCTLAGWVANQVDPNMPYQTENIAALTARIAAPCIAKVPYLAQPTPQHIAAYITLAPILQTQ